MHTIIKVLFIHTYALAAHLIYSYILSPQGVHIKQTICTHVTVNTYIHVLQYCRKLSFVLFQSIAIDQVTEVNLTCEPVDLINQCIVMWNVSYCYVRMCSYAQINLTYTCALVYNLQQLAVTQYQNSLLIVRCNMHINFDEVQIKTQLYIKHTSTVQHTKICLKILFAASVDAGKSLKSFVAIG